MKTAIVLDCGATNIRAIAVNSDGEILASHSIKNSTRPDAENENYLIWDIEEIWSKLCECCSKVAKKIDVKDVTGITVTTFGVDGAPVDAEGNIIYPVISWQCQRTAPIMGNIGKYIPIDKLYEQNGVLPFSFNTINKLIWLKENRPDVVNEMKHFMFISSLLINKLSGVNISEATMAGTSMLTDINNCDFSENILYKMGYRKDIFPPIAKSGDKVGKLTEDAANELGLIAGIDVIATGHDTQFAVFGAGATDTIPVLSSGTWEILMLRSKQVSISQKEFDLGITTEFDSEYGMYNPGKQYIASGLLEWVIKSFYSDLIGKDDMYDTIIDEVKLIPEECINISFKGDFSTSGNDGIISGLTMDTPRSHIYKAALNYLTDKALESLRSLEKMADFKAESLICVGGGSKNALWNQMKADKLGIPVKVVEQSETTVLGAAMYVFMGTGVYSDAEEARSKIKYGETYYPKNK